MVLRAAADPRRHPADRAADAFAVIIVSAPDEDAADALVAAEPGVAGGLFTAELHPFELMLTG